MSDPKSFLILNAVIVTLLVLSFLALRKKEQPTRLNMKKGNGPLENLPQVPVEVPLNVIFNYNGHSFDAYESLGVPAGSTLEEVRDGLQRSMALTTDSSSREFYNVAYDAIQKAHRSRR